MLAGIKERIGLEKDDEGFTLIELIVVIVIIGVLATMAIAVYSNIDENQEAPYVESSTVTQSELFTPSEPVDWTPLIIGGGALLGIGALGTSGFLVYKGVSAGKNSRRNKKELQEKEQRARTETIRRWDNVRSTYQQIVSRYAEYETDIWKALQYPAMHDVNVKETSAFLSQLRKTDMILKEQESSKTGTIGGTEELYQKLFNEVSTLDSAFGLAENNALKKKWSLVPKDEKKDLKQATQLLKHAENEGNSPQARRSYYEQLQKVVDRLNARHAHDIIPSATINLLASQEEQLMITAGATEENVNILNNNSTKNNTIAL